MSTAKRVVVVGAGLGGLAAAIRLAAADADVRVTLVERGAAPGGRAGRLERGGYSFDTGPTVLTMPGLLDELFALNGEALADHLQLVQLDPAYRAVFHDGSVLNLRASVEAMAAEVASVCGPAEAARFEAFAAHLRALYEATYDPFIDRNFDSPLDLASPGPLARLIRLGGFRRVYPLVASHLSDWRLRRIFTFQSMYAGMSPFQALGVYAIIAYMDTIAGVYYPRGGLNAVGVALAGLAQRLGVDVRYDTTVTRVETAGGRAVAVQTASHDEGRDDLGAPARSRGTRAPGDEGRDDLGAPGERLPADVVVLNPDLPVAYRDLLPPEATPWRVRRLRYSPSCVVVHLGLDRPLDGAAHHNIHFAQGYRESFDDLLSGRMQRDPSWFLTVPTRSEPDLAPGGSPAGGEVGFYLLPVPNLNGERVDWTAARGRLLAEAQQRLEHAGYGRVREATVVDEIVTPDDWAAAGMAAGTPFAASHHFGQTGPFRPRNVAPKVGGVVFTGSSTTPGVGVPMVLVSGKLAAQRALEMLGRSGSHAAGLDGDHKKVVVRR